jgi:hypothetical protein
LTKGCAVSRRPVFQSANSAPDGPRQRQPLLLAAACLIVLAGSAAGPAVPAAAASGIVFGTISGNGSGNLTVPVTSPTPLTSMTIHLWSGGADVLDLPFADFQNVNPGGSEQIYQLIVSEPALQNELGSLPLGTYTATADAADGSGDSVTDQALSGSFDYLNTPSVSISSTDAQTTYQGEPITLTGQLGIVPPGSPSGTIPTPWGGQQVTITQLSNNEQWTVTTASDGSYSITVPGVPTAFYVASVPASVTNIAASAPLAVEDLPVYAQTRLTASAPTVLAGQPQTISGTLTYAAGGGWQPAAGLLVTADSPGQAGMTATTNANGSFSMTMPVDPGTSGWDLSSPILDLNSDPFIAGAQITINVTQLWPAAITGFMASLSKYGVLTVGGCLASTIPPGPIEDYPTLEIQYSAARSGPWHELGTVGTGFVTGCAGAGFLASGPAPLASAYYRAYFAGDSAYGPATSSSSRAWLYQTRFSHFAVTPHKVAAGKHVTVRGTLQTLGRTWRGYAGQRVLLIYRPVGSKDWYGYKWVKTNRTGGFSATFADKVGTAYWSANYYGNKTHLVAGAPVVKVSVHRNAAAVARISAAAVQSGQLVSLLSPDVVPGAVWPAAIADRGDRRP